MVRFRALLGVLVLLVAPCVGAAEREPDRVRPQQRMGTIRTIARSADVARSLETLEMLRGTIAPGETFARHPLHEQLNAEVRTGLRRASRRVVRDALVEAVGFERRLGRSRTTAVPTTDQAADRFDVDFGLRGLRPRLKLGLLTRHGALSFTAEVDGSLRLHYGGGQGRTRFSLGRDEDGRLAAALRIAL